MDTLDLSSTRGVQGGGDTRRASAVEAIAVRLEAITSNEKLLGAKGIATNGARTLRTGLLASTTSNNVRYERNDKLLNDGGAIRSVEAPGRARVLPQQVSTIAQVHISDILGRASLGGFKKNTPPPSASMGRMLERTS